MYLIVTTTITLCWPKELDCRRNLSSPLNVTMELLSIKIHKRIFYDVISYRNSSIRVFSPRTWKLGQIWRSHKEKENPQILERPRSFPVPPSGKNSFQPPRQPKSKSWVYLETSQKEVKIFQGDTRFCNLKWALKILKVNSLTSNINYPSLTSSKRETLDLFKPVSRFQLHDLSAMGHRKNHFTLQYCQHLLTCKMVMRKLTLEDCEVRKQNGDAKCPADPKYMMNNSCCFYLSSTLLWLSLS